MCVECLYYLYGRTSLRFPRNEEGFSMFFDRRGSWGEDEDVWGDERYMGFDD